MAKRKRIPTGVDLGFDENIESVPRRLQHRTQLNAGTEFGEEIGLIWADDANLRAIADYIQRQRPKIHQYPGLLPIIQRFEKWYTSLGWTDVHVMINDTMLEARRFRAEVNEAMNQRIPDDWIPADSNVYSATRPKDTIFQALPDRPPEPWIPERYKMAASLAGGVTLALVVAKAIAGFSPVGLARHAISRARSK